ncbi:MAG: DUF4197 domain-containing protein [Gammaproteobacteria bacterium]|jgi:hypothetical protein|nr:DUF4197 domain-containing protein [Gammaproteobacteria bacterium]
MQTARPFAFTVVLVLVFVPLLGHADWRDLLDKLPLPSKSTTASGVQSLTDSEMTAGLKEALDKAAQLAVGQLGRDGGYLNNPAVHIPIPERLSWVEKGLRAVGQGAMVDEFEGTMNRAAEQAVPVALDEFRGAIRAMTLADAKTILTGPDDAATQYFRAQRGDSLREKFRPIVSAATARTGVTSSYKNMLGKAGGVSALVDTRSLDLDSYVTDKALDGLFLTMAQEEKRIRENPVARSTELLKKVFGAVDR